MWNPSEHFIGGQLYNQAISQAGSTIGSSLVEALGRYEKTKQEAEFNDATVDQLKQYVPAEQLARYHTMSGAQKTGVAMAAIRGATFDMQKQLKDSQTDEATARTNLLNAQASSEWAGTGAGGANDKLELTPEERDDYLKTGHFPLRTSGKSFQPVAMPDAADPPDLDATGNPIFTADGTMYRSAGKYKPVTGPMMQAKMMFDALRQQNPKGTEKAAKQPGFSAFHPSTWFGGNADTQLPKNPEDQSATAGPELVPPVAAGKVRVKSPKGEIGYIPTEQLVAAKKKGFTEAPQ